jgi:hypothetical protein
MRLLAPTLTFNGTARRFGATRTVSGSFEVDFIAYYGVRPAEWGKSRPRQSRSPRGVTVLGAMGKPNEPDPIGCWRSGESAGNPCMALNTPDIVR